MRRYAQLFVAPSTIVFTSLRSVKPTLSPDRNHNEEIADRQHRFRWHKKHLYRPHTAFTFDPTSWNRELVRESQNKNGDLSVVMRLKGLAEHAEESEQNKALIREGSSDEHDTPDGVEGSTSEEPADTAVLKYLPLHRRRYCAPRFASRRTTVDALVAKEKYQRSLLEGMELLETRRCAGGNGTQISFEATIFILCELLLGAEELIDALCLGATISNVEATWHLMQLCCRCLVNRPAEELEQERATLREETSLESLVEEVFVWSHPIVTKMNEIAAMVTLNEGALIPDIANIQLTSQELMERAILSLRKRSVDGIELDGDDISTFVSHLSVVHMQLLWKALERITNNEIYVDDAYGPFVLATEHELKGLHLLSRRHMTNLHSTKSKFTETLRPVNRKAVPQVIDDKRDHPRAIGESVVTPSEKLQRPIVPEEDVCAALRCLVSAIRMYTGSSGDASMEVHLSRSLLSLMRLLECTPNYDLSLSSVPDLIQAVACSGLVESDGMSLVLSGDGGSRLRVFHDIALLLTRLPLTEAASQKDLSNALWALATMRPEHFIAEKDEKEGVRIFSEYKRLRGLVLHTILAHQSCGILSPVELDRLMREDDNDEGSFLMSLVHCDAPLGRKLWRSLVSLYFQRGPGESSESDVAKCNLALLILRCHCRKPQQAVKTPRAEKTFFPAEEEDMPRLCRLAATSEDVAKQLLAGDQAAWEMVIQELPLRLSAVVEQPLAELCAIRVERLVTDAWQQFHSKR